MKYEYRSILLVKDGKSLTATEDNHLNHYFDEGWEYVDSITPAISAADYPKRGAVMVIIRKEKNLLPE